MLMKHVQYIVPIVVVIIAVETVASAVLACQTVHVQRSCGPRILTNQGHMMAEGLSASQSPKIT